MMTPAAPAAAPALDWHGLRAVVFDVDGTLYEQKPLQRLMRNRLLREALRRPRTVRDIRCLMRFRDMREAMAEQVLPGLALAQYAEPAAALRMSPEALQAVVERWMHKEPLPYLRACRFDGLSELFTELRARGIRIGVFSDYPCVDKLAALDLPADIAVAAVDPEVDRLKPNPTGLRVALARLGVTPAQTLFIGDRDERDGECARRAGCAYRLKVNRAPRDPFEFQHYRELLAQLPVNA